MNALLNLNTQIPVFGDETDDATFLEIVSDTVNGMLLETKVAGVSFVKIRDWFGPKWLGFSGKKLGAVGVHGVPLTMPPFNPNRVLSQRFYAFNPDSLAYEKNWPPFRLHPNQPSEENLDRYFQNGISSGALVWYSSDSARTGNGALMIYVTRRDPTDFDLVRISCGYLGCSAPTTKSGAPVPTALRIAKSRSNSSIVGKKRGARRVGMVESGVSENKRGNWNRWRDMACHVPTSRKRLASRGPFLLCPSHLGRVHTSSGRDSWSRRKASYTAYERFCAAGEAFISRL